MPYVFPHENLFALAVGLVVLGLLLFRFRLVRRRSRGAKTERSGD
ncbi:MAG: hypothetical protein ACKOCD_00805 [Nitrospiraceae bacterium]